MCHYRVIVFYILIVNLINCHFCIERNANSLIKAKSKSAFDQDLYEEAIDAEQCSLQLDYLSTNSTIATQFIDSSGKIPVGILEGNVNSPGNYYQCLGINDFVNDTIIQGKYCKVNVQLNLDPQMFNDFEKYSVNNQILKLENMAEFIRKGFGNIIHTRIELRNSTEKTIPALTIGICLPKVCSVSQALESSLQILPVNITFDEVLCRLPNDKPFAVADYVAIVLLSLIGIITLISTTIDIYQTRILKIECNSLVRSFSVYTNTRRLLTFHASDGMLQCLDGIRAISMMWVVVGHVYLWFIAAPLRNSLYLITEWYIKFSSTWIHAALLSVDTFFVMGGLLCVYTVLSKVKRQSTFIKGIPIFYIHRILRMWPLLGTMVLLQASILNHVSDGPFWQIVGYSAEICRSNWWKTMFFVQNYLTNTSICLSQTWYLAVDMQLYVIAPIVILFLFERKSMSFTALVVFLIASILSVSIISFSNTFSATIFKISEIQRTRDYANKYYFNTLARAPPFFVGMMYGYVLHLTRGKKFRISMIQNYIIWTLTFGLMAFCVFGIYPVLRNDHNSNMYDNFLNSYMRVIWAFSVGWIIFACAKGYGGPVNWFLCLSIWKLPARLSYALYLVHYPIIVMISGRIMEPRYFSDGEAFYTFFAVLSISFLFAFLLCVLIDAPFSVLIKHLMKVADPKKENIRINREDAENIENSKVKTTED